MIQFLDRDTDLPFGGLLGRRSPEAVGRVSATPLSDAMALIPESQWERQIAEITDRKAWPQDTWDRLKLPHDNQNGLNYCWAWSLKRCLQHDLLSRFGVFIDLAPESLGGSVRWSNAGNYLEDALMHATEHGICRREFIELHDIDPRGFKPGWEADAKLLRPVEFWELRNRAEVTTALLCGFAVYAGWARLRHAMAITALKWHQGRPIYRVPNSHADAGYWIAEQPDLGCFAIRTATRPDYIDSYPVLQGA